MKRNVVALMLLLPMLFVFVVFSSVKTASLGVPVSASGIEIVNRPADGYTIDLARYRGGESVRADVLPAAASDRGYFYEVDGESVEVDGEGGLLPKGTGESVVSVVSRDGGFRDSARVTVYSSRPVGIVCSLSSAEGELLSRGEKGYFASLSAGRYAFSARGTPEGREPPEISLEEGFCIPEEGSLFLPFSGRTKLSVRLWSERGGEPVLLGESVTLDVAPVRDESGCTVNGGNAALTCDREAEELSFYVQSEWEPRAEENPYLSGFSLEPLGEGRYRATVSLTEERTDFSFFLTDGERRKEVFVSFEDFDFGVGSDLPVQGDYVLALGEPVRFFALPSVPARSIGYRWRLAEGNARLEPSEDGAVCRVTAEERGRLVLVVTAERDGQQLDVFAKEVRAEAVGRVRAIQFTERADRGLAKRRAVAGLEYGEKGLLPVKTLLRMSLAGEGDGRDLNVFTSDGRVATAELVEGGVLLTPAGEGEVTVTAEWRGNTSYGETVRSSVTLYAVKDGVRVSTSPALYRAEREGRTVCLEADIRLGTDESGEPLPLSEREGLLGRTDTTFNREFYRLSSEERVENARVLHALELKGNVYGNGHALSAELFTLERDGAAPRWFRGPLVFVRLGQIASVAAQDNAAFLLRTDGVTLWNLTLAGCGDEALADGRGGYDLSALNCVGTVLEVNASASLLNCRFKNGRNLVRVYGGNRAGGGYFSAEREEPAVVRMEGCHLFQGREFLLKLGANRAVPSTKEDPEPPLCDGEGKPYTEDGALSPDFYEKYVLTDLTLSDSVLERSGLFCVGVECNFAGELLAAGAEDSFDGWAGTGGTSYAALLRLKGDVRLYDWKDLSLIDSSTLIETELSELKLDIASMLSCAASRFPEQYGHIIAEEGSKRLVHGGIAFYGGGRNYSRLISEGENGLAESRIGFSVLDGAEGNTGYQGKILPAAAGKRDFRFYLYAADGGHGPKEQFSAESAGTKYLGIRPLLPA